LAASIGPMVWEEEGPTLILKISKTDRNMPQSWPGLRRGQAAIEGA
jgi:hypothetical protein